jgi:Zn-dependent protease with chaperone function
MNFFENQDRARQNTQKLFGLFALSIAVMIAAIYIATLFLFRLAPKIWWHPGLFFVVASVIIVTILLPSIYKFMCLREGGCVIAQQLGGRQLIPDIASEEERQLLNIVEEMAIASGISVPEIYILDREPGINAFAAGFTPNDAVIGVTSGSLKQLNRDELQGVIGHEFSHILNGDMGLNLRLVALLHGVLFIYIAGELLMRGTWRLWWFFGSDDDEEGSTRMSLWLFGLAIMIIGGIGLICGRLIKAAVSRQREFLADASAVQFTRNPDGLTAAFEKLSSADSQISSPHAESASHMFFAKALNIDFWEEMFATHPPLDERIQKIRGVRIHNKAPKLSSRGSNSQDSLTIGFAGSNSHTTTPESVVNQVGNVTPAHFAHAQALLEQLPEPLRLGIREQQGAISILFALTFDTQNPEIHERQLTWLREVQPTELIEKALTLSSDITKLKPSVSLALVDLTIPTLRQLPAKECQRICKCIQGLGIAKRKLSLWDFVLQLILWHRLEPHLNPAANLTTQFNSIDEIWSDCLLVLSALARIGENRPDSIAYAFRSGVFRLPNASGQQQPEVPMKCSFADVKKSIERLRLASPKLKQTIVDACAHTVLVDNKVSDDEGNLLRAIAITLDCPIPPFLNPSKSNRRTSPAK